MMAMDNYVRVDDVNEALEESLRLYIELFQTGKMTFSEYSIILCFCKNLNEKFVDLEVEEFDER